jgi:hypothetical protein
MIEVYMIETKYCLSYMFWLKLTYLKVQQHVIEIYIYKMILKLIRNLFWLTQKKLI